MNDELDHIMGALRVPATGDELADESAVVDRMYHAHDSKGPTMFTSRRTRVATLVAAGVLGFGSVAAAGPAAMQMLTDDSAGEELDHEISEDEGMDGSETTGGEEPAEPEDDLEGTEDDLEGTEDDSEGTEDDDMAETEKSEVEVAVVEEDAASMPVMDDDPDTFFNEEDCLEGNHGKTVSAVARGELKLTVEVDGEKVDIEVRDAARSSCGKDFEADLDEDVDPEENVELEESEIEKIEESEPKGKPDHAGGKDKDKDKGKPDHAGGKGKGKGGRG